MNGVRSWMLVGTMALAGCAVLVVDVDVYKGPLANHREIQVRQVAAMAMAARPILIRLRNDLEGIELDPKGYVEEHAFRNSTARLVNDVLDQYEDVDGAAIASEARELLQRLERTRVEFQFGGDALASTLQARGGPMASAYAEFLQPGEWRPDMLLRPFVLGNEGVPQRYSSTELFEALASPTGVVLRDANSLFPGDNAAARRDEFVVTVNRIARAFLERRASIRRLLQLSLDLLARNAGAKRGGTTLVGELASIVETTMDYRLFAAAVLDANTSDHVTQLDDSAVLWLRTLQPVCAHLKSLASLEKPHPDEPGIEVPGFAYQEREVRALLAEPVRQRIIEQPAVAARAMATIDSWLATQDRWNDATQLARIGLDESFAKPVKRRFGLGRGSYKAGNEAIAETALTNAVIFVRDAATSLGGGRQDKGLDTLIREFLEEATRSANVLESPSYVALSGSLTHLAQALLSTANNETLLKSRQLGLPWLINNGLDRIWGTEEGESHVRVLQAIGWSILVQIDELRHWQDYRDAGKVGREVELAAVRQALALVPSVAMQGLLEDARTIAQRAHVDLAELESTGRRLGEDEAARQKELDDHKAKRHEIAQGIGVEGTNPVAITELAAGLSDLLEVLGEDGVLRKALTEVPKETRQAFADRLQDAIKKLLDEGAAKASPLKGAPAAFSRLRPKLEATASEDSTAAHRNGLLAAAKAQHTTLIQIAETDRLVTKTAGALAEIKTSRSANAEAIARQSQAETAAKAVVACLEQVEDHVIGVFSDASGALVRAVRKEHEQQCSVAKSEVDRLTSAAETARQDLETAEKAAQEATARQAAAMRALHLAPDDEAKVATQLARLQLLQRWLGDLTWLEGLRALVERRAGPWVAAQVAIASRNQKVEAAHAAACAYELRRIEKHSAEANLARLTHVLAGLVCVCDKAATAKWGMLQPEEFRAVTLACLARLPADTPGKADARTFVIAFGGLSLIDDAALEQAMDAKGVLDVVIAALRERHLADVSRYGADSAVAKRTKVALSVAYQHRTGLVYIRPPSAFLRSSYPSSSLQADPGLEWSNMLAEQAWHSVPGYSLLNPLFGIDGDGFAAVTGEIDKQFWQSINRVRVAGAGNTNYVVAKDDIGNWYVKSYAADSAPITRSAINLGMYAMGAKAGTDLLGALRNPTQQAKTGKSDLDAARLRFAARYAEAIANEAAAVRKGLLDPATGLAAALLATVNRELKVEPPDPTKRAAALQSIKDAGAVELTKADTAITAASSPADDVTTAQRVRSILEALRALRDYTRAVTSAIKGANVDKPEALVKLVQPAAHQAIRARLDALAAVVNSYESTLNVLSTTDDGTKDKEKP